MTINGDASPSVMKPNQSLDRETKNEKPVARQPEGEKEFSSDAKEPTWDDSAAAADPPMQEEEALAKELREGDGSSGGVSQPPWGSGEAAPASTAQKDQTLTKEPEEGNKFSGGHNQSTCESSNGRTRSINTKRRSYR